MPTATRRLAIREDGAYQPPSNPKGKTNGSAKLSREAETIAAFANVLPHERQIALLAELTEELTALGIAPPDLSPGAPIAEQYDGLSVRPSDDSVKSFVESLRETPGMLISKSGKTSGSLIESRRPADNRNYTDLTRHGLAATCR